MLFTIIIISYLVLQGYIVAECNGYSACID
jgi:hypothetical protein